LSGRSSAAEFERQVLDIGTGSGRLAIELVKTRGCDFRVVALDISPNMLIKARENAIERA
jgi:ubiquinone/menaquinone biosynthesis C-methylase UbiE